MNVSDAMFEMELAGVDAGDIDSIIELCANKGINSEFMDDELLKRGYERVFTVDYDEYGDFDDFDDDYSSRERFQHKNRFID